MSRRFHTDTRTSENFTESGLVSVTGESSPYWGRYIVKELLDNALEAGDKNQTPEIAVLCDIHGTEYNQFATSITVRDNGPGIPSSRIDEIFGDPDRFGGTKRHYALPTRGNQGNALMTLLGIQHVCGGPLQLRSKGREYEIRAGENIRTGQYEINVESTAVDGGSVSEQASDGTTVTEMPAATGAEITVDLGDRAQKYGGFTKIDETVRRFVTLNPHARFEYSVQPADGKGRAETYPANTPSSVETMTMGKNATTGKATWFSYDDFENRATADYRADASLTIPEFVSEFRGVSSRAKGAAVVDGFNDTFDFSIDCGLADATLGTLFENGNLELTLGGLYGVMCEETGAFSEGGLSSTLGSIGEDLKHSTIAIADSTDEGPTEIYETLTANDIEGVDSLQDLAVYYNGGAVVETDEPTDKTTPFTFELAAVPYQLRTSGWSEVKIGFGINQSVSYSEPSFPFLEIQYSNKTRSRDKVSGAFDELDHDYYVVCNLTCPNINFEDKGKQDFDTQPFKQTVEAVVGKAVRKIERDIRRPLNKLHEDPTPPPEPTLDGEKAPQDFCKQFVREKFDEGYAEGTEGGAHTIKQRQLFYVMRPMFREWCDENGYEYAYDASVGDDRSPELKYGTFTTNLKKYEEEVLGERVVYRNKRGFFVEPHSNRQVPLGTAAIIGSVKDLYRSRR